VTPARTATRRRGRPPPTTGSRRSSGRSAAGRSRTPARRWRSRTRCRPTTRTGLDDRYATAVETVVDALRACGAAVERGEPPDSFCPGDYSVRATGGGKIAGIAQRVRGEAALVAGSVTVADGASIRGVLAAVYDALGVAFDPDSVGSVAAAGGPADPTPVRTALEDALVDGRDRVLRDVTAL